MEQKGNRLSPSGVLQSAGLLILRVGTALILIWGHGWEKVADFTDLWSVFDDPIGIGSGISLTLAAFAEFVCAILVALGLFTRWATIPIIVDMVVILLFVHMDSPFGRQEPALLFLVPAIVLLITGPGWYSLDNLRRRRRRGASPTGPAEPAQELSPAEQMPTMDLLPGAEVHLPDKSSRPS